MERSQLFDLMGQLQLYGMKAAFDEIMATSVCCSDARASKTIEVRNKLGTSSTCVVARNHGELCKHKFLIAQSFF
jgi:hypothetical protein